ncbi:unnamed protein product [Lactuca saligna]|uniref:Uncharacterized protein n=1 Tax=Lactuca saligna TaxID=75948 RepID=A0AA35Z406_LACSI|nr:unnamed protein product [Lactuca saligna]
MIQDESVSPSPQAENVPPMPTLHEISKLGKDEANSQKQIVVAAIPNANATNDNQTIPETHDQSDTNDYGRFLDLGFIPQAIVPTIPLKVIYPRPDNSRHKSRHDPRTDTK